MRQNSAFHLLLLVSILLSKPLSAQVAGGFDYGNDWYVPGQPYLKMEVWEEGIYRVTAAELDAAGFPATTADPDFIQVIYRGEEQFVHVRQTNGTLDYLEFYGNRNDGRVDSLLYRNPDTKVHGPNEQPNRYTSLWSDTSAYYITVGPTPGLRMADFNDQNFGNYAAEPYFRYETFHEYHPNATPSPADYWNRGGGTQYDVKQSLNSYWITAEGYVGRSFKPGTELAVTLPTPHAANIGTTSLFRFRIYGKSSWQHITGVNIDGTDVYRDTTSGIRIETRDLLYYNALSNNTVVRFSAHGTQQNSDFNHYCWSTFRYDRTFDMDGASTIKMVEWQKNSNALFRFDNANVGSQALAYDLTNKIRCVGAGGGGQLSVVVPGAVNSRKFFIAADSAIKSPLLSTPELVNLQDPGAGADFVIVTHPSLMASAQNYKNYRDTASVNPMTAKVVTINEIYDEFGYGSPTPLAIQRFCKYALDNWNTAPRYFLLWGKGQYMLRGQEQYNLVPTFGYPATDWSYVSDFDHNIVDPVPAASIGRVNIYNNNEGQIYLDKVMEYEYTPWETWMKEGVFLGGGSDTTEQKPILNYLSLDYMSKLESAPAGGRGHYYQKFHTGQVSNSAWTSTERINEGATIIHFFGHSNSNIYDVDIQEPVLYQNYGKYPFMVAFGCYGGNFTANGKSFGERFILERDRGSIGYLANSTAGYLTPLGYFGNYLYPQMFVHRYGEPVGLAIKDALANYYADLDDQVYINHLKQMNLQGDPSITLYSAAKPDLAITEPEVFIEPANFSASDSSFTINVVAHNLGRVTQDSFYLSIRQLAPQAAGWITYDNVKFPPVQFRDTLEFVINNRLGTSMAGFNTFDIFIDSTDILDEYSEANNRINYQTVIPGNAPAILYPYDFAVIDEQNVTLSASSYVINNNPQVRYIFEIDTSITFNSPMWRNSGPVVGTSFLAEWDAPYAMTDSMVYYWRVRLADVPEPIWAQASFRYIPQRRGWAQAKEPQFFKNETERVVMDQVNRTWVFEQWFSDLHAFADNGNHGSYRLANGASASELPPNNGRRGINYTAIRKQDLEPTIRGTINGDWTYAAMPDAQGDVVAAIAAMNDGDYFLAVSEMFPRVEQWAPFVVDAFHMIGIDTSKLRNIDPSNSLIVLGRKGANDGIILTEPNVFDVSTQKWKVDLRTSLQANFPDGEVRSTIIGPARNWQELIWNWDEIGPFAIEDVEVSVYALRNDNSDSLIYRGLPEGSWALTQIDPIRFPYLRLEGMLKDSVELSAPQLDHWHVLYTPAGDLAIDPITNWDFQSDTVQQGEEVTVTFTAQNVSDFNMDSLLVRFTVTTPERLETEVGLVRFGPVPAMQARTFSYTFNSGAANGLGSVVLGIELNPNHDQPEQYHFNNYYNHRFFIVEDEINPILDVTFDGKHIMDGDIVSPNPEILIQLNDENLFLAVNDTAYEVHFGLKTPNPNNLPRLFIDGNPDMEKVPAQLPDNKAQVYFRPKNLEDGEYTLRVQGFDQTGNAAGKTEYEVDFTVVNASTVSNVLNYPNPFSTSTRFVYTLTGAEIPEVFEIQIFTITGKLVKVIDLTETNDVRYGYNITDYAWDGRDEFGDLLANGVYIYKVVTRLNGQTMDHREEGISDLFDNGYGKMYIMR